VWDSRIDAEMLLTEIAENRPLFTCLSKVAKNFGIRGFFNMEETKK